MRVITAPDSIEDGNDPTVFLAGGITDCPWWQDKIIYLLKDYTGYTILNPRRRNFPIHDPAAAKEQITWEFTALCYADVFSMWFSAGPSPQPICMYELGRHLAIHEGRYDLEHVVIGVEPGYLREQDVRIQTSLVSFDVAQRISSSLEQHAENILKALGELDESGRVKWHG